MQNNSIQRLLPIDGTIAVFCVPAEELAFRLDSKDEQAGCGLNKGAVLCVDVKMRPRMVVWLRPGIDSGSVLRSTLRCLSIPPSLEIRGPATFLFAPTRLASTAAPNTTCLCLASPPCLYFVSLVRCFGENAE